MFQESTFGKKIAQMRNISATPSRNLEYRDVKPHLKLHVLGHEGAEAHEGKDEEEVGEEVAHEELVPHESHDGCVEALDHLLKLVAAPGRIRIQGLLLVPPRRVRVLLLSI